MLKSYLKIAFRNLLKNKSFSFINVFGLAASLSVCLLCILLIKDSHSYDQFHADTDQVYRLITTPVRKSGNVEAYASSPYRVGQALYEDYSQVEYWVPLMRTFNSDVRYNDNTLSNRGLFTNASFFEVFGFELSAGDPLTALNDPYSVVLTHDLAERIFKNADPIGQYLEMPAYETPFQVTGVLKPFPGKTHLKFDALGSMSTQLALDKLPESRNFSTNWLDYYMTYNFVKLKNGSGKEEVEAALKDIAGTRYTDLQLESRDMGYNFSIQALDDITPGPHFSNNMGDAMPEQVLWFFSILGIIVMLSACFNYTNLTVARSLTRAKEVGVRKVMGATRGQVFGQFISESLVVALFALGLGYFILEFLTPILSKTPLMTMADVSFDKDFQVVGWFFLFTILVGLVAGLLPATVLSKFSPLSIMQKLQNVRLFRWIGMRKALIVFQFAISLVFILCLSIAWKQINYAVAENFGADRTDIVNVYMQGNELGKLQAAFTQLPQVKKISATSHLMGTWQDSKEDVRIDQGDEAVGVRDYAVDHRFIDNFGLELIAGENFPDHPNQQHEVFAIVNETFLHQFDLGSPQEAVGRSLLISDSSLVSIRGVVKDFLYKPLTYSLEPLLIRYQPERLNVINLTVSGTDLPTTVAAIERTWKQVDEEQTIVYQFYDETVAENFSNIKELAKVVGIVGVLGLVIACLGLLGMAIYSVETKAKEISIRKVIGASASDLVRHLSRGYVMLLLIAVLVAVPASYLIGSQLLQTFAFSIPLNVWVFLPGVLVLILLGILTVGSQTVRAAFGNPVDNLRNE
ncbi:MAG: ABC transporter permease [Bacteroidota bacterium]